MRIKTQVLTLLFSLAAPVIFAQTPAGTQPPTGTQTPVVSTPKEDAHHIVRDVHNARKEKKIRRQDVKNGNAKGAVKATRKIRRDKKNARKNAEDLKDKGVKHPIRRIKHYRHNH